jgi:small subunit ribosomal protein S3
VGQKVNPIGFRIPVTKDWKSRWFAGKTQFGPLLQEDLKIREHVSSELQNAAISKVVIERFGRRVRVTIFSGRPGIIISGRFGPASAPGGPRGQERGADRGARRGAGLDKLKTSLAKITGDKEVLLDIKEVRQPELDAQLVAENVAQQLVRRIAFRRAMKRAIQTAMQLGADGIKIRCSGRLNGAELARTEQYKDGKVPLHTLRANIDYGFSEAHTLAGLIGVKVWICKPQNWEDMKNASDAKTRRSPKGAARRPRGNREQQ